MTTGVRCERCKKLLTMSDFYRDVSQEMISAYKFCGKPEFLKYCSDCRKKK